MHEKVYDKFESELRKYVLANSGKPNGQVVKAVRQALGSNFNNIKHAGMLESQLNWLRRDLAMNDCIATGSGRTRQRTNEWVKRFCPRNGNGPVLRVKSPEGAASADALQVKSPNGRRRIGGSQDGRHHQIHGPRNPVGIHGSHAGGR